MLGTGDRASRAGGQRAAGEGLRDVMTEELFSMLLIFFSGYHFKIQQNTIMKFCIISLICFSCQT